MNTFDSCIVIPSQVHWSEDRFYNTCGRYIECEYEILKADKVDNYLVNNFKKAIRMAKKKKYKATLIIYGVVIFNNIKNWHYINNEDIAIISGCETPNCDAMIIKENVFDTILGFKYIPNDVTIGQIVEKLIQLFNVKIKIKRPFIREIHLEYTYVNKKPMVSCLCLTYCRPDLLEEAVECFLRQNYDNKELIILNDNNKIKLHFDHPDVKIFNFDERFETLGDKRNKSIELASGDVFMTWDDDDIHLPNRITNSIENMRGGLCFDRRWIIIDSFGKYHMHSNNATSLNTMAVTRDRLDTMRYDKVNGGEDCMLLLKLCFDTSIYGIKNTDFNYIYRFGNWEHATGKQKLPNDEGELQEITLKPHWKLDYIKIASDMLKIEVSKYNQFQITNQLHI